jgi:hypothetical protein
MKMTIRLLLLSALVLATLAPLAAQVKFTPRVGVNASALDANLTAINAEAEARAGWNAGIDLRLGDGVIFLNPGLHYYSYTTRLLQGLDQPNNIDLSSENTVQSLRAPVNLGLRLTGDNGLLGLYLKGGVTPAYVLGITQKEGNILPALSYKLDELNRFTWGGNAGVGIDFLFLTAELNYEIGLTDFFKNVEGRNNILTFSVGLKF